MADWIPRTSSQVYLGPKLLLGLGSLAVVALLNPGAVLAQIGSNSSPTVRGRNDRSSQTPPNIQPHNLPALARQQVGVTLTYDPDYQVISFPGGDVEPSTGVCSDVIIRALRLQGLDLQQAVHQDMRRSFAAYPKLWGLRTTDRNIDHRRVPNLEVWMKRQGWKVPGIGPYEQRSYKPGDIVTWNLGGGITHIGLVSDRQAPQTTRPLILHNIGAGTQEEDILFRFRIREHFRPGNLSTTGEVTNRPNHRTQEPSTNNRPQKARGPSQQRTPNETLRLSPTRNQQPDSNL